MFGMTNSSSGGITLRLASKNTACSYGVGAIKSTNSCSCASRWNRLARITVSVTDGNFCACSGVWGHRAVTEIEVETGEVRKETYSPS